jgi:uncharacterized membrane protein YeiH
VIGAVPPLAFADWRYAVAAVPASVAVFWLHPRLNRLRRTVLLLDAAGLGLFTVTGTVKALEARRAAGGCVPGRHAHRDLLTGEIPAVLQRDIYAIVAPGGAILVTALHGFRRAGQVSLALAALLITGARLLALVRRWSAPVAVP